MHDYTLDMRGITALGFLVKIDTSKALTALGSAILPSSAFGFKRYAVVTFVNSHPAGVLTGGCRSYWLSCPNSM